MSAVIGEARGGLGTVEVATADRSTVGLVIRGVAGADSRTLELDEAGAYQLVRAIIEHTPTSHEARDWLVTLGECLGYEVTAVPKPPVWLPGDVAQIDYSGAVRWAFVHEEGVTISMGELYDTDFLDRLYRDRRARLIMRDGKPVTDDPSSPSVNVP